MNRQKVAKSFLILSLTIFLLNNLFVLRWLFIRSSPKFTADFYNKLFSYRHLILTWFSAWCLASGLKGCWSWQDNSFNNTVSWNNSVSTSQTVSSSGLFVVGTSTGTIRGFHSNYEDQVSTFAVHKFYHEVFHGPYREISCIVAVDETSIALCSPEGIA